MWNPYNLPVGEDYVSIPPVIVSPFTIHEITEVPYQIAKRNLRELQQVSGGGEGVKIAVIDTGVDLDHPELKSSIAKAVDFTDSRSGAHDIAGHGSHVASLIAGEKCGGAPNAKIYAYKALGDQGWGRSSWIANAVVMAIRDKVDVINMSLGSPTPSSEIYQALKAAHRAGILVFAATGNDAGTRNGFPADFNDVCAAVAAIDSERRHASFSNAGQGTDLCDYGVNVPGAKTGGGYVLMSGTSMATPVCAGIVANRLSYEQKYALPPMPSPDERYRQIERNCDDLGREGRGPRTGWGQLNADRYFGTSPEQTQPTPDQPSPKPVEPGKREMIGSIWRQPNGDVAVVNRTESAIVL